jgi:catechol 2,3-dioxygenase-like lactoylglutathione lyase family enzyme
MAFHHVALATRDLAGTHRFYTEAMGFRLAKVEAASTPDGGWAKHVFYDTGRGMIAFWDLHDDTIGDAFPTDLNRSLGLPGWVNHLAFDAPTAEDLDARRQRWQAQGLTVLELDHEWCRSIYATDPNGITVEWCHSTRGLDESDATAAAALIDDPAPALNPRVPPMTVHEPAAAATPA